MGKGLLISLSTKQKVNGGSSTKGEINAWENSMPYVLWLCLFIKVQGWGVNDKLFEQDNQDAERLANNRNELITKQTKTYQHLILLYH